MTGIAAIASRIDSIENRLEDFRTSTAEFGGTGGRAAVSADAMDANRSGAVFSTWKMRPIHMPRSAPSSLVR